MCETHQNLDTDEVKALPPAAAQPTVVIPESRERELVPAGQPFTSPTLPIYTAKSKEQAAYGVRQSLRAIVANEQNWPTNPIMKWRRNKLETDALREIAEQLGMQGIPRDKASIMRLKPVIRQHLLDTLGIENLEDCQDRWIPEFLKKKIH